MQKLIIENQRNHHIRKLLSAKSYYSRSAQRLQQVVPFRDHSAHHLRIIQQNNRLEQSLQKIMSRNISKESFSVRQRLFKLKKRASQRPTSLQNQAICIKILKAKSNLNSQFRKERKEQLKQWLGLHRPTRLGLLPLQHQYSKARVKSLSKTKQKGLSKLMNRNPNKFCKPV